MNKKSLLIAAVFTTALTFTACSSHSLTDSVPEVSEKSSSSSVDFDDLLEEDYKASSSSKHTGKSSASEDEEESSSSQKESSKSSSSNSEEASSSSKKQVILEDDDDVTELPIRSSSSSIQSSSSKINIFVPDEPVVNIPSGTCSAPVSESVQTALSIANEDAADMIEAAYKGHITDFKDYSGLAKNRYGKILNLYPSNCNAQFGYAISTLANLYNDSEIEKIVDSYKYYLPDNILDLSGISMQNAIIRTLNGVSDDASTTFTRQAQYIVVEKVLPAIDSSIVYMQNILSAKDYNLVMEVNDVIREFDKSEFAPVLGALFALKASMTIIASVDLEASRNLSYDWITTVRDIETDYPYLTISQSRAVNTLLNLVNVESPFSKVKEEWLREWNRVPSYIDSALAEAKAGFEYSLDESYIAGSQDYDIYVVGNGYDADISRSEMQDLIDNIEKAQNMMSSNYEIEIRNVPVVVNVRKLFRITDGIQQYLPYFTYEDYTDLSTYYFTDRRGTMTASFSSFLNGPYSAPNDAYGKIYFPDPSFGGVFPEFESQADIWNFLKSIQ